MIEFSLCLNTISPSFSHLKQGVCLETLQYLLFVFWLDLECGVSILTNCQIVFLRLCRYSILLFGRSGDLIICFFFSLFVSIFWFPFLNSVFCLEYFYSNITKYITEMCVCSDAFHHRCAQLCCSWNSETSSWTGTHRDLHSRFRFQPRDSLLCLFALIFLLFFLELLTEIFSFLIRYCWLIWTSAL